MNRSEKIDFLSKQLSDRVNKTYLEEKSNQFINALFIVEKAKYEKRI